MRRIFVTIVIGSIAMTGCITSYRAGVPAGSIAVIAHRGASAYAPENTLAAFRTAIDRGADWFELDCTLTSDGEVIVIHDDDVDRTTNGRGQVALQTLAELQALDAGTWFDPRFAGEKLPALGEALDLAKGRIGVYIEIKNAADDTALMQRILDIPDAAQTHFTRGQRRKTMQLIEASGTRNLALAERVIALVRERGMQTEVVIQSFSPIVCAAALERAPELRVELLGNEDEEDSSRWPAYMRWCYLLDVKGFNPNLKSLTKERLDAFHRGHRSVAVWTVDDLGDMARLASWGADAIITNRPDVCLEVLKSSRNR